VELKKLKKTIHDILQYSLNHAHFYGKKTPNVLCMESVKLLCQPCGKCAMPMLPEKCHTSL
jgi:hypothetical protein